MLLVGTEALRSHHIVLRDSRDVDFISTLDEYQHWVREVKGVLKTHYPISGNKFVAQTIHGTIYEFEIAWEGSAADDLLKLYQGTASPGVCLALKLTHRYLRNNPHFLKTMEDIWALRNIGVQVPDNLKDWMIKREQETYRYSHPNLKQSKDGFFTDDVPYTYDHDTLHIAVKHLEFPAYVYYKSDDEQVYCSRDKFFALPELTRLYGVLEESYVLALERSIIPHPGTLTPEQAFRMALIKVCTSITSGWFREYAWENYYKVVELYEDNYVSKFLRALNRGEVIKL